MLEEIKLEVTSKCLLNCVHCSTNGCKEAASYLPVHLIESVVQQASRLGCRNIHLSGGEPFLFPDLAHILNVICSCGFHYKVYTSGIIQESPIMPVSIDDLMKLKPLGLSHLVFSLFSHQPIRHDQITGVVGSFEATTTAIRNALYTGLETEVHFVAMKSNIDDLLPLIEFLEKLGVKQISILRFVPQGRGHTNSDQLLPNALDYFRLGSMIKSTLAKKTGINLRIGSPFNFLLLKKPTHCNSGRTRMIIDSEGFAYPCDALKQVRIDDMMVDNNINRNCLSEIIQESQIFRLIRESQPSDDCKGCEHYKRCLGGCLAQRYLVDINLQDPACLLRLKQNLTLHPLTPQHQIQKGL